MPYFPSILYQVAPIGDVLSTHNAMYRLNSEDFSKFLLPLDIIFWANFYERTHKNLNKKQKFLRIFENFLDFFQVFRSFSKFCFFVQQDAVTCYPPNDSPWNSASDCSNEIVVRRCEKMLSRVL